MIGVCSLVENVVELKVFDLRNWVVFVGMVLSVVCC